jgi:hypothetical protein
VSKFIEERIRLVRSMAENADPFIKRRLLDLATKYEGQLSRTIPPSNVLNELKATPTLPTRSER